MQANATMWLVVWNMWAYGPPPLAEDATVGIVGVFRTAREAMAFIEGYRHATGQRAVFPTDPEGDRGYELDVREVDVDELGYLLGSLGLLADEPHEIRHQKAS